MTISLTKEQTAQIRVAAGDLNTAEVKNSGPA